MVSRSSSLNTFTIFSANALLSVSICCWTSAPRILEKVLYFANYIVTDPGDTPLSKCQILTGKRIPRHARKV